MKCPKYEADDISHGYGVNCGDYDAAAIIQRNLYEPMKEIGERYPKWLEDHKTSLSEEDYNRYSDQHTLIQESKGVYETNPNNFTKIVELMQKMQECGHPPNDIVQELAPDFDLSQLGQLSPEMLEGQQNCSIM